jgi:hypothetical protein
LTICKPDDKVIESAPNQRCRGKKGRRTDWWHHNLSAVYRCVADRTVGRFMCSLWGAQTASGSPLYEEAFERRYGGNDGRN